MHTVTSADGTRIAYDRTGAGVPLILVAGAFSYRRYPGQVKLAELLADRFTVCNYHRRGRGDSGDTALYAVDREIEDLAGHCCIVPSLGTPEHRPSVWLAQIERARSSKAMRSR
jgi:pimeloyl-ACP methyl ester carboxylesterase